MASEILLDWDRLSLRQLWWACPSLAGFLLCAWRRFRGKQLGKGVFPGHRFDEEFVVDRRPMSQELAQDCQQIIENHPQEQLTLVNYYRVPAWPGRNEGQGAAMLSGDWKLGLR
jgi:hypothetical protein